ncbi:MAG: hypothetical protein GVY22_17565 [Gammaproteobacteria bacterium]|nr:hypothetical protein [Gammaproteobacteria bacterium]
MIDEKDRAAARNGMPGTSFSDGGLGYVLGSNERDAERRRNQVAYGGPSESSNLPLLILAVCTGVPLLIVAEAEWLPVPWWGWWLFFIVGTYGLNFILRLLPNWLSGSVMGLLLGGLAAFLGWHSGGLFWSASAGLGTTIVMYLLFSRLE